MSMPRRLLAPLLLAVAGLSALPASADWLVLRDGGVIETDGGWEVEGRIVVFRRADGSLASIRSSEVDVEMSHRRTAAARASRATTEAAPRPTESVDEPKAVMVLTDADVRHVDPRAQLRDRGGEGVEGQPDEAPPNGSEPGGERRDGRAPAEGALRVTGWRTISDMSFPGTRIGGTIRNTSEEFALDMELTVRLTDANGRTVGSTQADLRTRALEPGASTPFEAAFSGVYTYVGIDFEATSFDAVRQGASE